MRVALGLVALSVLACSEPSTGILHVRVVDAVVGEEVPARLELRDERGISWVAEDAVPLRFECLLQPLPDWAAERVSVSRELRNPHTGTTQFYADGAARIAVPPGRYGLRAFRGIEYEVVRFDPTRDDVKQVELLRNGEPIPAPVEPTSPGELRLRVSHDVGESAWFALRVSGDKVGEAPLQAALPDWAVSAGDRYMNFREHSERSEAFYAGRGRVRPSAAHTAPIWVTLRGSSVAAQPRGQELARAALARLDALEARLSEQHVEEQTLWDWLPYSDGVSLEHLRRNRPALLRAIAGARERYQAMLPDAAR